MFPSSYGSDKVSVGSTTVCKVSGISLPEMYKSSQIITDDSVRDFDGLPAAWCILLKIKAKKKKKLIITMSYKILI